MADLGATATLVSADLPVREAILAQTGVLFVVAGTAPCPAGGGTPIPKRWNPGTSTWDVIPGP